MDSHNKKTLTYFTFLVYLLQEIGVEIGSHSKNIIHLVAVTSCKQHGD